MARVEESLRKESTILNKRAEALMNLLDSKDAEDADQKKLRASSSVSAFGTGLSLASLRSKMHGSDEDG